jgi:hypothetical protein
VNHDLRRRLIGALENRHWTHLDAERAASGIASFYQAAEGEWKVWPTGNLVRPDLYRVARRADEASVYDSPQAGRAGDVANAMNELERHGPDATGTP